MMLQNMALKGKNARDVERMSMDALEAIVRLMNSNHVSIKDSIEEKIKNFKAQLFFENKL